MSFLNEGHTFAPEESQVNASGREAANTQGLPGGAVAAAGPGAQAMFHESMLMQERDAARQRMALAAQGAGQIAQGVMAQGQGQQPRMDTQPMAEQGGPAKGRAGVELPQAYAPQRQRMLGYSPHIHNLARQHMMTQAAYNNAMLDAQGVPQDGGAPPARNMWHPLFEENK